MSGFSLGEVVRRLQRSEIGHRADQSDSELIHDYLQDHDPFAFERIVRRHGGLVWNVCLRTLNSSHDAEEAFQSVFLIAIQKMTSLRNHPSLPGWLHRVTIRVASQIRSQRNRQQLRQKLFAENFLHPCEPKGEDRELASIIDEEVDRLPDRFRKAFILCVLKGLTNEQAAKQLGCPKGTVESRLARARSRLRQRLVDRGIAPAALISLAVTSSRVPELLARQAVSFSSHSTVTLIPNLSPSILSLAQGAMQTMAISKMKWSIAVVVSVCLSFTGIGWLSSTLYADGEGALQVQVRRDLPKDPQEAIQFLLQENARLRKELVETRMKLDEQAALIEFSKKKLAAGPTATKEQRIVTGVEIDKALKEKLAAEKAFAIAADTAKLLKVIEFEKDPKKLDELKMGLLKIHAAEADAKQKAQLELELSAQIKDIVTAGEKTLKVIGLPTSPEEKTLKVIGVPATSESKTLESKTITVVGVPSSDKAKEAELLKAKQAIEKQILELKAAADKERHSKEQSAIEKMKGALGKVQEAQAEAHKHQKIQIEVHDKIHADDAKKIEALKKQILEIELGSKKKAEDAKKAEESVKHKLELIIGDKIKAEKAKAQEESSKAEAQKNQLILELQLDNKQIVDKIKAEKAKAEKVKEEASKLEIIRKREKELVDQKAKAEAEKIEAMKKRDLEIARAQKQKADAEFEKLAKELEALKTEKGVSLKKDNTFRFATSTNKAVKTVILDRDDVLKVVADPKDPSAITGKALKAGSVTIELIDVDGKKRTIHVTIKD